MPGRRTPGNGHGCGPRTAAGTLPRPDRSYVRGDRRPMSVLLAAALAAAVPAAGSPETGSPGAAAAPRPNVLVILADDHRYDALGFAGHPFLKTPHLDALAAGGVHCDHAIVTTSLCSPSRASLLTGLYAHNHGVTDNYNAPSGGLVWFPKHLQNAGYETAFVGKWHMGDTDEKQPGFDHWVSFRGQGTYYPDGRGTSRKVPQNSDGTLTVNGTRVDQKGYITDELTDYALDWLKDRPAAAGGGDGEEEDAKPWLMYVSHKAVHSDFVPADRHRGTYDGAVWETPPSFFPQNSPHRRPPPLAAGSAKQPPRGRLRLQPAADGRKRLRPRRVPPAVLRSDPRSRRNHRTSDRLGWKRPARRRTRWWCTSATTASSSGSRV